MRPNRNAGTRVSSKQAAARKVYIDLKGMANWVCYTCQGVRAKTDQRGDKVSYTLVRDEGEAEVELFPEIIPYSSIGSVSVKDLTDLCDKSAAVGEARPVMYKGTQRLMHAVIREYAHKYEEMDEYSTIFKHILSLRESPDLKVSLSGIEESLGLKGTQISTVTIVINNSRITLNCAGPTSMPVTSRAKLFEAIMSQAPQELAKLVNCRCFKV